MTNNPTIDGVSRETVQNAIEALTRHLAGHAPMQVPPSKSDSDLVREDLRALLDAPAVERQDASESIATMVTEWVEGGIRMGTDWRNGLQGIIQKRLERFGEPELAALQSTIAQLQARVQELESGRGEPVGTLKRVGQVIVFDAIGDPHIRDGMEVFTSPPAPVAVVPTTEQFREAFVLSKYVDDDQADDLSEIATQACLDATAALNGERK